MRGARKLGDNRAEVKKAFLSEYSKCGTMWWAAQRAGVNRNTITEWRKSDPQFDAEVLIAYEQSTELLEITAFQRALDPKFKSSALLMMFLLKSRRPNVYRDVVETKGHLELTGAGGGPIQMQQKDMVALKALTKDELKKIAGMKLDDSLIAKLGSDTNGTSHETP